jgi:YVTN family beta-propeller protein
VKVEITSVASFLPVRRKVVATFYLASYPSLWYDAISFERRCASNAVVFYDSVSNQVSIINTHTNKVTQTLPVGSQPQGVAVDTHSGTAYVVNLASQTVTILSPENTTVRH